MVEVEVHQDLVVRMVVKCMVKMVLFQKTEHLALIVGCVQQDQVVNLVLVVDQETFLMVVLVEVEVSMVMAVMGRFMEVVENLT